MCHCHYLLFFNLECGEIYFPSKLFLPGQRVKELAAGFWGACNCLGRSQIHWMYCNGVKRGRSGINKPLISEAQKVWAQETCPLSTKFLLSAGGEPGITLARTFCWLSCQASLRSGCCTTATTNISGSMAFWPQQTGEAWQGSIYTSRNEGG